MTRRGFTLVEILVALALLAVALTAGMRALAQSADGAGSLKARTLALWVAQDRLAVAQLTEPVLGTTRGDVVQAGMPFAWRSSVTVTPNPGLRRVDIVVTEPAQPDYALARLTGYVAVVAR